MKFNFEFNRYSPREEELYGTILTLGNGHIGLRGEIELEPTIYGTTVAGIYDYAPYFYREIVNAPRVIGLQMMFSGEPLNLSTHKLSRYERELNIEEGTLKTWVHMETHKGVKIQYESLRIVHGKRKNLIILKFKFQASKGGLLTLVNPIETDVANPSYRPEIMVKHCSLKELYFDEKSIYAEVRTLDERYNIGIGSSLITEEKVERSVIKSSRGIAEVLSLQVRPNKVYEFVKYVVISSKNDENLKEEVLGELKEAVGLGFGKLYEEHREYWNDIWKKAKIEIEGDDEAEKGLNFSLFHLIQSLPRDSNISLTARGIHGFGYRGHVFWDTEIYALPFFIAVFPEDARRMLMYRYRNLESAKENAKLNGYDGAQFPWESADDGYEATPSLVPLDMAGKEVVRIYTGEEEHHITADIAYTVDLYYKFTRDEEFMSKYGLEIILETARFWASRVELDEKRGYVIRRVIGPDEYHEHVDNSFFTNLMAKHNLLLGVAYFKKALELGGEWMETIKRAGVDEEEVRGWFQVAERIYIPRQVEGVFEEFDGYFELEDYNLDPYGIGEARLPEEIRKRIGKTRLIKQADVIAAQYLLKEQFDLETIKKNFDYYIVRTTHASSLSMPAYSIVASWLDYGDLAYDYFMKCAYIDLKNIYGNTHDGFHLATAGGVWQALFRGFCGIDIKEDMIEISPKLPQKWKSVKLRFFFRGAWIDLVIKNNEIKVKLLNELKSVRVYAFGKEVVLGPGEEVTLEK
ncbi:glycoside hydrolase family 65 protein [Thermococcus argininiproducens]|uniref:Glycoside hydrolase family 65 protein n=1 Tax=Thermococcus argininiproducens TaxID=2866384 RepID=A0A9E7MAW1_9EURY|nr:glycosyl hydrolase family 65 protein [Thermococcus argininiproducens]USH00677.1 glycoside hydrolase family 65 protein [Thermococcus argininiproducens]